jgi:ABC-type transporter Mla subunit MlaD
MKAAYDRLQPASQGRYRALVVVCREVLGLGAGPGEGGLTDFRAGNLNQMLWLFLRLLASRESITDTIARVDRRQLESGLESLKARLASAGDPEGALARSLRATLEIQEKRLANIDTATNSLAVIDAELERIEQQVRLVREESAVTRSPEALSARLDAVSSTLSETSRWMDQHSDLMSDMTSLDLDAASVPSLPRTSSEPPLEPEEPDERQPPRPPRPRVGQRQR